MPRLTPSLVVSVCLVAAGLHSGPAATQPEDDAGEALELAEAAGRWLIDRGIPAAEGTYWPPDALGPRQPAQDLSGGTAGIVVFLAALSQATGDVRYREAALAGADYLAAFIRDPDAFDNTSRRASLYAGISGIGAALVAVDGMADGAYRPAVDLVVGRLDDWATRQGNAMRWSDAFNDLLYGDAGTTLFLAFVADRYDDPRAMKLAVEGGHGLLEQAEQEGAGKWWRFRRDRPFNLPNFSHGTAGVAYVLGTLSMSTGDDVFAHAAADGLRYLRDVGRLDEQPLSIPYGWPDAAWEGVNAYGWGHGIAGTALAFRRLEQAGISGDAAPGLRMQALASLVDSGLPGTPSAPYAESPTPLDFRFGRAGVLSVLARLEASGEAANRVMNRLVAHLADTATVEGGRASWVIDVPPFMGEGQGSFTGLFHGAAGIGLALLHRHAAAVGDGPYVLLPDDPRWVPGRD